MLAGPAYLLRGLATWRRRPGLMLLGVLPALLVLLALLAALVGLLFVVDDLAGWMTPFLDDSDGLLRDGVRLTLAAAIVVGFVVLAAVTFVALTLAVGDPAYARIWRETERELGGEVPSGEVGLLRSVTDGVRLVGLGAATGLGIAVVGLLPVVGALAAAAGGFTVSAWLLAGELLSRPLEARGLDAAARADLVRGRRGTVLAFGMAVQACFLVPLGAVAVMPAAVVGATGLARDLLAEEVSRPARPAPR